MPAVLKSSLLCKKGDRTSLWLAGPSGLHLNLTHARQHQALRHELAYKEVPTGQPSGVYSLTTDPEI